MSSLLLQTKLAIDDLKSLPFYRTSYYGIISIFLISDREKSLTRLYDIISADSGLAERILRVANSPHYGLSGRIADIKYAILLLGLDEIKSLAYAMMTESIFSNEQNLLDIKKLLAHNQKVAFITSAISDIVPVLTPNEAYVGGLLHDIGRLIFCKIDYEKYKSIPIDNMLQFETEHFGCTHEEVAAYYLKDAHLPPEIIEMARRHHYPYGVEHHRLETVMITVAEAILRQIEPDDWSDSFLAESDLALLKSEIAIGERETEYILSKYENITERYKSYFLVTEKPPSI